MGVNQAQPLEACRCRPESVEIGDDDFLVISNDDITDFSSPADENTCLSIDLS